MENQGIIIRTVICGDSDLILRVLTPNSGKIALMARGGRKSNRRFSGGLEVFDHGRFLLKVGRGKMPLLANFAPISNFPELRVDLDKLSCACLICEAFDLLIHEDAHENNQEVFELLKIGLQSICESDSTKTSLRCLFLALQGLLEICGFLSSDTSKDASARALIVLLQQIEEIANQELKSKTMIYQLIESLRKEREKAAA